MRNVFRFLLCIDRFCMAHAMPRIDAPTSTYLSAGSLAILANVQWDLQLHAACLTALEDENRFLKEADMQFRFEVSSITVIAATAPSATTGWAQKPPCVRLYTVLKAARNSGEPFNTITTFLAGRLGDVISFVPLPSAIYALSHVLGTAAMATTMTAKRHLVTLINPITGR